MHFYAMTAVSSVFNLEPRTKFVIATVMLLMTLTVFIVRYSEKTGHHSIAMVSAYVGFYWMGFLLYLVLSLLSFDLYRVFLYLAGKVFSHNLDFLKIKVSKSFYLSVLCSTCVCVYGYFEARTLHIERVVIRTNKITAPVKIAQISDVHVGLIIRDERIKEIVAAIEQEQPDILVSTGDLVDSQLDNISSYAQYFEAFHPPSGKYAVAGNHEFYAGLHQSLDFTELSGFKVLRNEAVNIGNSIVIAGVDDPEVSNYSPLFFERISLDAKERAAATEVHRLQEQELLMGIPPQKYTILLKHRPYLNKPEHRLFDLQLSGHTHKGQIFPFNFLTWLYYSKQTGLSGLTAWVYIPHHSGLIKVGQRGVLYVNRGAGTWGPPIRVLSPPEVTIIELIPDDMKTH